MGIEGIVVVFLSIKLGDGACKEPEQPEYYENKDLEHVITPVKVERLVELLKQSNLTKMRLNSCDKALLTGSIWSIVGRLTD